MWQSCGVPCSVPSSNMAVIQKREHRGTPSKKTAPQEDRKGLSTRDTLDKQKKESRAGRRRGGYCCLDMAVFFLLQGGTGWWVTVALLW